MVLFLLYLNPLLSAFRIPHYEQRLRSLHYKKRFSVTVNDLCPRIANVMEASREVARSRRLRKLLELVLALGNYMNRGARGNASGFRLTSLNRLADTKSSSAKGTTLLHYLVRNYIILLIYVLNTIKSQWISILGSNCREKIQRYLAFGE